MSNRMNFGQSSANAILSKYKYQAGRRGHDWLLSDAQALSMMGSNCAYCGEEPYQTYKVKGGYGYFTYNGIDRIDNELGYIVDNVVACCGTCNYAKGTRDFFEFSEWIFKVNNHMKGV